MGGIMNFPPSPKAIPLDDVFQQLLATVSTLTGIHQMLRVMSTKGLHQTADDCQCLHVCE